MEIIPAIDLQNGEAVRLYKGDYEKKTIYSRQPEELAQKFEKFGANYLHLVDLDGAKSGRPENQATIEKIKQLTHLKIEIGGGIRTLETIAFYLEELKLDRVILGTAALDTQFLSAALMRYGAKKIIVGVDIKDGFVSTSGWLKTSQIPYLDFLKELEHLGVRKTVITDISKDGTLTGPNFTLYDQIAQETKLEFIVSGGVKNSADIKRARLSNFSGIIVGKAFYEGKLDLQKEFENVD